MQYPSHHYAQKTHAGSQAAREDGLLDVSKTEEKMYVSRVTFHFTF
jgi:hypothetical protein